MSFIGHADAVHALRRGLPPVTLFTGPRSVGKWTLTHHLADHHLIPMCDRMVYPDGLTMDNVRAVIAFVARAPFGAIKLVQARLDGTSGAALTALLKTLEEPPQTARFLLTATDWIPPTIVSRAHVYRLGLLATDEVRQILIAQGVAPSAASRAAAAGRGQVRHAQVAIASGDKARAAVLDLLRALGTGDRAVYENAFRGFDESARAALHIWLREAITGNWAVFTADESYGLHRNHDRLHAMVLALSHAERGAPRLAVRAALERFLPRA
jgi:DNA polymerase III delta prime subunit